MKTTLRAVAAVGVAWCWLTAIAAEKPSQSLPESGRTAEYDYDPPAPGSYLLPELGRAADGEVLDADGRQRSLRALMADRVVLLSFIYTRCAAPDGCPHATGMLSQIQEISRTDPALQKGLRLITLSFDPSHDTPEVMSDYGFGRTGEQKAAEWKFLTTRSPEDLKPILEAYGQAVDRKKNAADPLGPYYHTLRIFLIDRAGEIRNIYSFGFLDPRLVLADIRTLLDEESKAGSAHE